ncbi:MAG TPA: glycosyltransferase family 2 protein [Ilumatobacteraceae bacterium]
MSSEQFSTDDADADARSRLDVVVVSFETPGLLDSCLRSIAASPRAGNVVVVDNSTTSACADVAADRHPSVTLIRPPANVGYGAAANIGVEATTTDVVLILNADTWLAAGSVEALLDSFDRHADAAVVGPRLSTESGVVQPSCARFPTPASVWLHQSGVWKLFRRTPLGPVTQPFFEPAGAGVVPWVLGAALAVRRSAFERVGGFDPAFFMYYEEVDLCRRLAAIGYTTRFAPTANVHHVGGASTAGDAATMRRTMYRSLATYTARHGGRGQSLLLRVAVVAAEMMQMLRDVALAILRRPRRPHLAAARNRWSTVGDALRGWPAASAAVSVERVAA